ncbi:MAG: folate-binding protein [Opitutae bacterium]|nr:folate-binding protein [Opitutae bacterium]
MKVAGNDAFEFLQGQFSNELRRPPGSVTYGLWLNPKGKVVADSHVLRMAANEFHIASVKSTAANIRQRLEEYIVADEVVLTDETDRAHGLTIWGQGSNAGIKSLLGEVPAPGCFLQRGGLMIHRGRRFPGETFEVFGPKDALAEAEAELLSHGAVRADETELEFARICAGIPAVPADLGPGDLPNEGGLDDTALSYTKGCYLGQEVMARLKNLGQVRRRLHVVRGRGPTPAPRAALYQGEKKTGEIRSVAACADEFVALAMLSLVNLQREAGLSLEPSGPANISLAPHG